MAQGTIDLRAPRTRGRLAEGSFRWLTLAAGAALLVILGLMLIKLGQVSAPAWRQKTGELLTGRTWAPAENHFGALPFVYGTIVTAAIALILATPVGVATALFVTEMAPQRIRRPVAALVDLLAAVPSVIYGLWGIAVLVPLLTPLEQMLHRRLDFIPLFGGKENVSGLGYMTAGVLLAIMILPTISAVSREVLLTVPRTQREAALALGATRWETIRMAVLPTARGGIIGAIILGLGRALGETIAVLLVIGGARVMHASVLQPGYTMASVIANEFVETTNALHAQSLVAVALILFMLTLLVNIGARVIIRRGARRAGVRHAA